MKNLKARKYLARKNLDQLKFTAKKQNSPKKIDLKKNWAKINQPQRNSVRKNGFKKIRQRKKNFSQKIFAPPPKENQLLKVQPGKNLLPRKKSDLKKFGPK